MDFVSAVDLKLAEEYKAHITSLAPSIGMQLRNATIDGFSSASESLLGIVLFFAESRPTLILWLAILFVPRAHALASLSAASRSGFSP